MRQKLNTPGTDLSPLERQLMEILWKEKSSTAEEIRAALAPRHPLMDSTVRTVLRRLEDKGYVTHTVQGKAFVYRGVEPPRSVAVRAVRMILDQFCNGSLEQLLLGMVENEAVDPEDLRNLARKLAQESPGKRRSPKKNPRKRKE